MSQIFSSNTFSTFVTSGTFSINPSSYGTSWPQIYSTNSTSVPTYTINNSGTGALKNSIFVEGDAEFNGDIRWKGRSIAKLLEKIEERLCILEPPPEKLEKYQALKKAYDHYKMMEHLIGED